MRLRVLVAGMWMCSCIAMGLAQEEHQMPPDAPLSIETLPIEPTVVKTGDLIMQAYRARFRDLRAEGKEIIVLEDRMAPENLPVAPFEAVSLAVQKRQLGDEHIWDFVYRFRIINPTKAVHTLPSFSFYWLTRDLGEEIDELEVLQHETDPVPVQYVTTLTDGGAVDIRDAIALGAFGRHARVFRLVAYGVAPLPLVVWIFMLVGIVRRPKRSGKRRPPMHREVDAEVPAVQEMPSIRDARRALRSDLSAFAGFSSGPGEQVAVEAPRALVISLRAYIRGELPELNPGDTPKDIQRYIETRVPRGARKNGLSVLAARLVALQTALENGTAIGEAVGETRAMEQVVDDLRPHRLAIQRAADLLRRG